ncbi:MAG: hypothetical protein IPI65_21485 [Bacteroidetes bacterium]|nr:hypothetical protein [Bacteroidota bacterium]
MILKTTYYETEIIYTHYFNSIFAQAQYSKLMDFGTIETGAYPYFAEFILQMDIYMALPQIGDYIMMAPYLKLKQMAPIL